ncbi:hypothetical protein TWF481_006652 [Arthrobotrys musiformis]|uniref:Uncharacterized protein n=1 Tax=Arthrobotrys musiformis TaxID=47236 RepID=A0AAV9W964_9PEZI
MAPSRIPKPAVSASLENAAKIRKEKAIVKNTLKARLLQRHQGITANDAPDSSFWDIEAVEKSSSMTQRKASQLKPSKDVVEASVWDLPATQEGVAATKGRPSSKIPVKKDSQRPKTKPTNKATKKQVKNPEPDDEYIPDESPEVMLKTKKPKQRKTSACESKVPVPKPMTDSSPSISRSLPVATYSPEPEPELAGEARDVTLVQEPGNDSLFCPKIENVVPSTARPIMTSQPEPTTNSVGAPPRIRMSQSIVIKAVAVPYDTPEAAGPQLGPGDDVVDEDVYGSVEEEIKPRTPSPIPSSDPVIRADASVSTESAPQPTKIPSPKTPSHRFRRYLANKKIPDLRAKGRELAERLRSLGQQVRVTKRKAISPSGEPIVAEDEPPKKLKVSNNQKSAAGRKGAFPAPLIKKRPKLTLRRPPMKLNKQKREVVSAGCNKDTKVGGLQGPVKNSDSGSDSTLAITNISGILTEQLKEDHKRREEELELRLEKIKGDIKDQALEAIEQFRGVYQTIERTNYAQVKELMQGLSDAFGATDLQMSHIRWQYKEDKNAKALVNRYKEISHRIDVGVQEKKDASEKMKRIEARVEESYNKCMELLDVIDAENYAIDFQYGVAIHGEAYMKRHYEVPKGYKSPVNPAGIIPRLNHIQETLTDMITKEPTFTAHSEWFYKDLLKKAIEKVRNEEAHHVIAIGSD